jgi:serine protease Do
MYKQTMTGARATALSATAALALCVGLGMTPNAAKAAEYAPSFAPLVDQVRNAVVNISTTELQQNSRAESDDGQDDQQNPLNDFMRRFGMNPNMRQFRSGPVKALGSGFIVDPSGFVVTNNHVVRNGTDIKVTLQDGTTLNAKVVGTDPVADLAVLKVDAGHPLPSVPFGDSNKAQVAYVDYLQVDAPINQGNSGGPTFNEDGQVIGINTAIYSPNGGGSVGIGFAIPSNIAKPIVDQLEKSGSVTRGWLGVEMQAITPDMEDALGLSSTNGVVVADVVPDGPAAKAGLKSGDVIVGFGDQAIKSTHELALAVANTTPGQSVQAKILRDAKPETVSVTIDKLTRGKAGTVVGENEAEKGGLGLSLAPLDKNTREQLGLSGAVSGAVVQGVRPDSPAEEQGIRTGDVIVRVDNTKIENPGDAAEAVKRATKAGKKAVAVLLNRNGNNVFLAIPLTHNAG